MDDEDDRSNNETSKHEPADYKEPYAWNLYRYGVNQASFDARKLFNHPAFVDVTIDYTGKKVQYFDHADFSDVTVKWSGREIKAHRVVLCSHSEYFQAALSPKHQFQKAQTGIIELHDDDPRAVETMLRWMYSGECQGTESWKTTLAETIAADKYGVQRLEDELSSVLALQIMDPEAPWSSDAARGLPVRERYLEVFARTLKYSDRRERIGFAVAQLFRCRNQQIFALVYSATGPARSWADHYIYHAATLIAIAGSTFCRSKAFLTHVQETPELAVEVIAHLEAGVRNDVRLAYPHTTL